MTPLTEQQQAAQDSLHDLVKDAVESIGKIRRSDISRHEKDKLLKEIQESLWQIDTLRRRC